MSDVVVSARRNGKSLRLMEQFNEVCPVGSAVIYWPGERTGEGRKSVTRSAAWMLGGHTPVVLVEGYPGGIALSHVMGYTPDRTPRRPAAPWPTGLAELLARRPELRGIGITAVAEARWTR